LMVKWLRFVIAMLALLFARPAVTQGPQPIPQLRTEGDARQLIVNDRPLLILGGELANSSSSSVDYMRPIWPRLKQLNLNTVLVPVSWELIEPQEGRFDFSVPDGMLEGARRNGLHIVILWFGSWKNSMSSYVPAWVKRDERRFPRAQAADGRTLEMLTPLAAANAAADARAFAAFMRHLRQVDPQRTVLMVQVENEIGMIPSARDHSALADAALAKGVPSALLPKGHPSGTWAQVFGRDGDERFMAWNYARYVERVAAAGKAEYPLPMYVNAALVRPGAQPGQYPSAGPLPHLFDIWRLGAPSIDMLAPDIYFPNFVEWASKYQIAGNPLFVPEANRAGQEEAPANAFFAFGALDAIGFSPFSIDSISPEGQPLGQAYRMLDGISPLILSAQAHGTIRGFRPPVAFDGTVDEAPATARLGGYRLIVAFVDPWTPRDKQNIAAHGGLAIQLAPDEFLFAGSGITVTFAAADGAGHAGIESAWEGRFEQGQWKPGRLLNGDETHQGRHVRLPPGNFSIQRVRLYRYR
jgi:beta-galactosidase GanA